MKNLLLLALMAFGFTVDAQDMQQKKYSKTPTGYLMVLTQGDNLFEHLEAFAKAENIPSANFSGMGFVNITFGFFDAKTQQYNPKDFKDMELGQYERFHCLAKRQAIAPCPRRGVG